MLNKTRVKTVNRLESYLENNEQRYFYITNDPNPESTKILDDDSEEVIRSKEIQQKIKDKMYATFDEDTKLWSIPLPDFFRNSSSKHKSIYIESFQFFNAKGQSDIGTTIHSPSLMDGNFSQFDNIVGLATLGIDRFFPIQSNMDKIEFFFADYMNYQERLPAEEIIEQEKTDDEGNVLYERIVIDKNNTTTVPNSHKVIDMIESPYVNNDKSDKEKAQVIAWLPKDMDILKMDLSDESAMDFSISQEEMQSGYYFPVPVRWTNGARSKLTIDFQKTQGKPLVYTTDLKKYRPDVFAKIFGDDQVGETEDSVNENWSLYQVDYSKYFDDKESGSFFYETFYKKTFNTHQKTLSQTTAKVERQRVNEAGEKLYYAAKRIESTDKGKNGKVIMEEIRKPIRFFIITKLTY